MTDFISFLSAHTSLWTKCHVYQYTCDITTSCLIPYHISTQLLCKHGSSRQWYALHLTDPPTYLLPFISSRPASGTQSANCLVQQEPCYIRRHWRTWYVLLQFHGRLAYTWADWRRSAALSNRLYGPYQGTWRFNLKGRLQIQLRPCLHHRHTLCHRDFRHSRPLRQGQLNTYPAKWLPDRSCRWAASPQLFEILPELYQPST